MVKRLSAHIGAIASEYDVVVVGSGYGGAIAASRLARATPKLRVCLLERGRELHPGEYPDTEIEALGQLQAHVPDGHVGAPTALFDFHVDDELNVLVGCGLGGTSLINANVSLRATDAVFDDPCWPSVLRGRPDALVPYYERAESMLQPVPHPATPTLKKLLAHQHSAETLHAPFRRLPINVTFEDGVNHAGVEQRACNGCGDCVSGCNHGAKNTVLMNYLPDARRHGAEIFTEVRVAWLERLADGRWAVRYSLQDGGRETFDAPPLTVSAATVVLAAGTLGSTEILLRSRARGLRLSARLGERFSGNGDVLGFSYNSDVEVNGIGFGAAAPDGREPVGPCITSAIDLRAGDLTQQMIVEEGSIPGALSAFMPLALAAAAAAVGDDTDAGLADELREGARRADSYVRGAYHGATRHTQTYLVMAHDDTDGRLTLEHDRLRVRWPGVGRKPIFEAVARRLRAASAALGGTYVKNPIWSRLFGHDLVSVHPLGGCVMADDAAHGVVDHKGRVFDGDTGDGVHAGLYVMDGAIVPRSLGVNPLLTISALAERAAELLVHDLGGRVDYAPSELPLPGALPKPGIRFTETMAGWFSTEETASPTLAAARGERDGSRLRFVLTITSDDLEALLTDASHAAQAVGTVEAPALSPAPLQVSRGTFQCLVKDPGDPRARRMLYRLHLTSIEGRAFEFEGEKLIRDDQGLDLWADTTTLHVTVTEGGRRVGRGVLTLAPADFARQLTTLQVTGVESRLERLRWQARFGAFFAGALFDTYGAVFARPTAFDPGAPPRKRRTLRVGAPVVYDVPTADGSRIRLTRYTGGTKGPVLLVHGLGVSSRIFSLDTLETNLLEFLYAHEYDVWLVDLRVSPELPSARERSTADAVAAYDFPAAVDKVRAVTGAPDVQFVVHCYGSTTFFMALLGGLQGVRSVVASQVAAHAVAPFGTRVKTGLHVPEFLDALGVDTLDAFVGDDRGWLAKLYDRALALYPVELEERCTSATCHRITFMYSLLYEHDQLDRATHDTLHETFGVANMDAFKHLGAIVRAGHVVRADGADTYMAHVARLALPITFIHGAENSCFLPESTRRTFDWLVAAHGPDRYARHVIPGYGHIDCIMGKNAARDVYPLILAHLEQTARVGAPAARARR